MVEETCNTKINNGNEMIENCIFHAKNVEEKIVKTTWDKGQLNSEAIFLGLKSPKKQAVLFERIPNTFDLVC